jgi:hypothetical protein
LNGTVPQLESVAPQKVNTMPVSFALSQPQLETPYTPPQHTFFDGISNLQINLSFSQIILIVVVCLIAGYFLRTSKLPEKRKRKNEEILLEGEE